MSGIVKYSDQTFESIKHINEFGQEFWFSRELQGVLEYTEWRNFIHIIDKAKTACKNSSADVNDHFADVGKMVEIGSGAERQVDDIMLSRYRASFSLKEVPACQATLYLTSGLSHRREP